MITHLNPFRGLTKGSNNIILDLEHHDIYLISMKCNDSEMVSRIDIESSKVTFIR